MYDFQAVTDLQIKALSDRGVQTAAKVSSQPQKRLQNQAAVQNQMRSMGQAVVEQAAREKKWRVQMMARGKRHQKIFLNRVLDRSR